MTTGQGLTGNMIGAFNRIGQKAKGSSPEEILENANMNFRVVKTPLYDSTGTALKSQYCRTARSDTGDTLGVVSRSYVPHHPIDLVNLADKAGLLSGIDRIGMVKNGQKVFMSFKMPEGFSFGHGSAEEQIDIYWYLMSSNDGSMAVKLVPSPVRLICDNQFPMLHGFLTNQGINPNILSMRHSSIISQREDSLLKVLNIGDGLIKNFAEQASQLLTVQMEQHDRIEYYIDVLKINQNSEVMKGGKEYDATNPYGLGTRGNNTIDKLLELEEAPTNTVGDMYGTALGAFNTVTEFIDYEWTYNKDGTPNEKRMESAVLGPAAAQKNRALQLLTV